YTPAIPVATFTHDQAATYCASIGGALPNLSQMIDVGSANPRSQNWPTKFPYFVDTPGRVYDLEKNRSSETANPTAYVTCTTPISMTVTPTPPYTATDTTTIEAGDTETFTVQVTDASGRPVEGATIRTSTSDTTTTDCNSCLTGADGKVLITQTAKTSTTDTVTTFTLDVTGERKVIRTKRLPDSDSASLTLLAKAEYAFMKGHPLGAGQNKTKWQVTDRYGNPHNLLPISDSGAIVTWFNKGRGEVEVTSPYATSATQTVRVKVRSAKGSILADKSQSLHAVSGWYTTSNPYDGPILRVGGYAKPEYGKGQNLIASDYYCRTLMLELFDQYSCHLDPKYFLWVKTYRSTKPWSVGGGTRTNTGLRPGYAAGAYVSNKYPSDGVFAYGFKAKELGVEWFVGLRDAITQDSLAGNPCNEATPYRYGSWGLISADQSDGSKYMVELTYTPREPPGLSIIGVYMIYNRGLQSMLLHPRNSANYGRDTFDPKLMTYGAGHLSSYLEGYADRTKPNDEYWFGRKFYMKNFNMTKDSSRAKKYRSKVFCTVQY
ncbi:hypothetical protein CGI23_25505, partial [Vibrio parahaemolyticus]